MPTREDLAQIYRDAGLTPPARFVGDNTPVTQQDVANTENFVGAGGAGANREETRQRTRDGGGGVTAEQVLAMFAQAGKDPGLHTDRTREDPLTRAARIAAEINSGQRTQTDVLRAIESLPGGGGGGVVSPTGGQVTPEQVLRWFEQLGKDPGVHGDGSRTDPSARAIRIAQEINSGQRNQGDVFQAIRNLPDDPRADVPTAEELQAIIDEALAGLTPDPIDFRAAAANLFPWFPDELLDVFADAWTKFDDPNLALAAVRQDSRYDAIFPGIKRDDGSIRMTEAEWFGVREAYARLLTEFGLNASVWEPQFAALMEGDVSPQEFAGRLGGAYERIITNIPEVREFYARQFGLEMTDAAIFASFLDPDIADAILSRRMSVAQVGGEGLARGFDVTDAFAGRLANAGIDQLAARQLFIDAEGRLPTLNELSRRFADPDAAFDVEEFAEATIFGDATQRRRIRRLQASETSLFSDQFGAVATSDEFAVTGITAR